MTNEDFERLKAVCEKEGFEIKENCSEIGLFQIAKKEPKKRIEINPELVGSLYGGFEKCFKKDHTKFRKHLASLMEKFLNDEV